MTLKGLIKTGAVTLVLLSVYFSYFKYVDFSNNCSISIRPSVFEWNSRNIKKSLAALRYGYPEMYGQVCRNIDKIVANPSCGGWEGGCYYGKKGEIYVSTAHNEFVAWTAAVIAHEACHDIQNKERRPYDEGECYAISHETLTTLVEI